MEKFNIEKALAGEPILVEYGNLGKRKTAKGYIIRVPNSTSTFLIVAANESVVISESRLDYICYYGQFNKSIRNSTAAYPHFSILGMYKEQLDFAHWHILNDRYNYLAQDEDGTWWAYQNEPYISGEEWCAFGDDKCRCCLNEFLREQEIPSCDDWKKSLIKRGAM